MVNFKYRIWLVLHGLKYLFLFGIGKVPSHVIRAFLYRALGLRLGRRAVIYLGEKIPAFQPNPLGASLPIPFV